MSYALIVTMLLNDHATVDTFEMDYGLTLADCHMAMTDYESTAIAMNYGLGCISETAEQTKSISLPIELPIDRE
jgi:hypothetical protein